MAFGKFKPMQMANSSAPAPATRSGVVTGPVKNVQDMLAGIPVADTPRNHPTNREVANKVIQAGAPVRKVSKGAMPGAVLVKRSKGAPGPQGY